jgi:hypothetical protein
VSAADLSAAQNTLVPGERRQPLRRHSVETFPTGGTSSSSLVPQDPLQHLREIMMRERVCMSESALTSEMKQRMATDPEFRKQLARKIWLESRQLRYRRLDPRLGQRNRWLAN